LLYQLLYLVFDIVLLNDHVLARLPLKVWLS
jgi:hypothetical protein